MLREVIGKGASIEEAIEKAITELGVKKEDCSIEILEAPKKSLFGKLKGEAVVKASYETNENSQSAASAIKVVSPENISNKKLEIAVSYLKSILDKMGLSDVEMSIEEKEDGGMIVFNGEGVAVLIGHHGETLDALQYLVALTCNRIDGDYYRITLDCGNYREKREATLQGLANRIAQKVKRTGRSQLLEPMNPYERRIIHSIVSEIDGVFSKSKGEEPNRRVVIMSETPSKNYNNNKRENNYNKKPYKRERTMEEILKNDFKDKEASAELYSKIEF